jgi:pimeloyl-ACP methyl ester carboxylesterase
VTRTRERTGEVLAPVRTSELAIETPSGTRLSVRITGEPGGEPVVLLHGLAMTRDYVLPGTQILERAGHRVIAYDARGHGSSSRAPDRRYGYPELTADLLFVLDALELDRAVLVGQSMGSHTALRLALQQPRRVAALALVTPAFDPVHYPLPEDVLEAERTASGIRHGGIPGFVTGLRALPDPDADASFRALTARRMRRHVDLRALADVIESLLPSRPIESLEQLRSLTMPTLVVGSWDEYDWRHPYALARQYAAAIPGCGFVCEAPGRAPLAWRGRELAPHVLELAERARR